MKRNSDTGEQSPEQIKEQARRQREAAKRTLALQKNNDGKVPGGAPIVKGEGGFQANPDALDPNDPASNAAITPDPDKAIARSKRESGPTGATPQTAGAKRNRPSRAKKSAATVKKTPAAK